MWLYRSPVLYTNGGILTCLKNSKDCDSTARSSVLVQYNQIARRYSKNYYEALGVKEGCSTKEIKEAYVKLCKQFHPDRNPNDEALHKKFVHLNEAYSVLIKPETRLQYDSQLQSLRHQQSFKAAGTYSTHASARNHGHPFQEEPFMHNARQQAEWRDETIWSMRDKSQDRYYGNQPYYGIKGIKRVSNMTIAGGCVLLLLTGIFIHYLTFKYGVQLSKEVNERNKKNALLYAQSKAAAIENGDELQRELLKQRLEMSERNFKN